MESLVFANMINLLHQERRKMLERSLSRRESSTFDSGP